MIQLILASNNAKKIKEINDLLNNKIQVISLKEAGILEDIEEPYHTFEQNAWAKADFVFKKTGIPTMSEDSGLVVPALNDEPGVFSARYAGSPTNDLKNTQKLLENMARINDRAAYYKTVVCIVGLKDDQYFDGICEGKIHTSMQGDGGFGYDPIFIPNGYDKTFGELDTSIKQSISHRSKAIQKLIQFLEQNQ